MKCHEIIEKSYYYVVNGSNRKPTANIKPGTSQQEKINSRINRIRFDEPDMHLYGFITIFNTTKSRLEALEHDIKADLVDAGFKHFGNDHFRFTFSHGYTRNEQYKMVSMAILIKAMLYCEQYNLKYELTISD